MTVQHPTQSVNRPNTSGRGRSVLLLASGSEHLDDIARQLSADEFEVICAPSLAMAKTRLKDRSIQAILADAELSTSTAYSAIDSLRSHGAVPTGCPAIAFSVNSGPVDRVRALHRGCVDFLALPMYYPELFARLELAMTRSTALPEISTIDGGLRIDTSARSVTIHGRPIEVSPTEYCLLLRLARDPERVWTKAELLLEIWGHRTVGTTRTLDAHACRLRTKLRAVGGARYIENAWGVGYRLVGR